MRAGGMDKEGVNRITGHDPDYDTDLIYQHITPLDGGTLSLIDRLQHENSVVLVDSDIEFQTEEIFLSRNRTDKFVLSAADLSLMIPVDRSVTAGDRNDRGVKAKRKLPTTIIGTGGSAPKTQKTTVPETPVFVTSLLMPKTAPVSGLLLHLKRSAK